MYKAITSCRCCNGINLYDCLNFGEQPLANNYHYGDKLPTIPLKLVICNDCNLAQLSVAVEPLEMFNNYLYVSGTSETFRSHCYDLAKYITSFNPKKVLDIGCNEGLLLSYLDGVERVGVDPAKNLSNIAKSRGIEVITECWNSKLASGFDKKFDVITAMNVLGHVSDPVDFLIGCKTVVSDNGVIIIEVPDIRELLRYREFDTIYHEHQSYFSIESLENCANRAGLYIIDEYKFLIHGGSLRVVLSKTPRASLKSRKYDILRSDFEEFARETISCKISLSNICRQLANTHSLVGYGASAKGNTLLNYVGIKLDYIVDDNPMKHNLLTPGMNIEICDVDRLIRSHQAVAVLLLAWNFKSEIVSRLHKAGVKGKLINYVPNIYVEAI